MKNTSLNTNRLSFFTFLCLSILSTLQIFGSEAREQDKEQAEEEENTIIITGSRIKRTDYELANPVVVIDVEELEKSGFANVYDALLELTQATGVVANEQSANSGASAGQALNLRGFGPGRTLALLNGKRVTDNPTASYNRGSFFNWAIIPIAAVRRIEIFTGGASAIYGSDAVAGVINVILKEDLDDVTVTARYGETPEGGGESRRLQLIGGKIGENYSLTYAIEHQDQNPILGKNRDHLDSALDDPNLVDGNQPNWRVHSWMFDYSIFEFITPTEEECSQFGAFATPVPPPYIGNWCVYDSVGEFSIRNDRKRNSAVINFNYVLDNETEFYARALYWDSKTNNNMWKKWVQYIGPTPSYNFINTRYTFENEEMPPRGGYDLSTYVAVLGFQGMWGDYDWQTGLNYSRSTEFKKGQAFRASAVYEIGQITDGNPWVPFSLDEVSDNVTGYRTTDAESSSLSWDFTFNGSLVELESGDISFSAIAEYQHTEYAIEVDELSRLTQDTTVGWTNGSVDFGAGERDRYALGIELAIPITEELELGLASRYDDYQDGSSVGGRFTHQANLKYRPTSNLLIRTAYNESFRAPDLHFLFRERRDAFVAGRASDIARCRYDEEVGAQTNLYPECMRYPVYGRLLEYGNPQLAEETGENIGAGLVVDFTRDLSFTIDYYKISLDNQVSMQSFASLMEAEANCWLGTNHEGDEIYDRNSEECQQAFAAIVRYEPIDLNGDNYITANELGEIDRIEASYINVSNLEQSGVDITINYVLDTDNWGDFNFSLKSSHVNTYDTTNLDVTRDIKLTSREPTERINFTMAWQYEDFSSALFINKTGSILNLRCYTGIDSSGNGYVSQYSGTCTQLNADGSGFREKTDDDIRANLRLAYKFTDNFDMSLQINNITDETGPVDKTFGWPYTDFNIYNITGREVFLEARYRF